MSDGDLVQVPAHPGNPYPLGRFVWHDPQNKLHRALPLGATPLPDVSRFWTSPDVYDQQSDNCTIESAVGLCRSGAYNKFFKPSWTKFDTEDERIAAYERSKEYDPWPGSDYAGSSTDAPFKLLRAEGAITAWKWLFGPLEVKEWVMRHGPVGIGTNWYDSMFSPVRGFLMITPSSQVVGGHAYRVVGYNAKRREFRMVNSWGRNWGQYGRAWLTEDTLARLLAEQGEAVTLPI